MKIIPVILSGGSGTRLWPLSRKDKPKQYLSLIEEQTLLQATIRRVQEIKNIGDPVVICSSDHRFLVAEQLQQINVKNKTILLESVGKNTAPAIAVAAHHVKDELLLILPADHIIENTQAFHQAVQTAQEIAEKGKLITFGITPTEPNTGYGYIKTEIQENSSFGHEILEIKQFKEKPDQHKAEQYIKDGNYLWNSGMFLFTSKAYLKELNKYYPDIIQEAEKSIEKSTKDLDFIRLSPFTSQLPSISIDYAVMEKTPNSAVIPLNAGWSDIGSWSTLQEIDTKDTNGNVIKGEVTTVETTDCYIHAEHHMVATIGIENVIIVDTPDATLVASRDKAHLVKRIVENIELSSNNNNHLTTMQRKVYRPWGWYDTIDTGHRFKVKRICVNPKASISLQKHHHRAEHWIIVKGTAKITNGKNTHLLTENQSTYIPIGVAHQLENTGKLLLEMIEVQSGSYLEEDDIERIEDPYERSDNGVS